MNGIKAQISSIYFLSITIVLLKYFALWIEGWWAVSIFATGLIVFVFLFGLNLFLLFKVISKKLFRFYILLPIIISIVSAWIVLGNPIEKLVEMTRSPVILSGYCEHTVTTAAIVFREDSTFNYNAGAFLASEVYNGTYLFKNDTIELNFNKNNPDNISDLLVVKGNLIVELSDTIKHRHHFKIYIDELE